MFDNHKKAIEISGIPYVRIEIPRDYDGSESIPVVGVDWSAEDLACRISTSPGVAAGAVLDVDVTLETHTWQELKDAGIASIYFPPGIDYEASVDVSVVVVKWLDGDLTPPNVPLSDVLGEPVNMYMEIVKTDGSGGRFIAGDVIVTETTQ